jgi:hypothetical protein
MNLLREKNLEFVGMSSVGPSIAVVTDVDPRAMKKLLKPMGLSIAFSSKVDNHGLVVTHKK